MFRNLSQSLLKSEIGRRTLFMFALTLRKGRHRIVISPDGLQTVCMRHDRSQ